MKIYTIKYYFYGSDQIVPKNYEELLLHFLHPIILGENNEYHDKTSLYSVSQLYNSTKTTNTGFLFNKGAIWKIRTPSLEVFKDFYLKSKNHIGKELGCGLFLKSVDFYKEEIIGLNSITIGTTPIFLGQNENSDKPDHITYKHNELSTKKMKSVFMTKSHKLGYYISEDDFNIEFDHNSPLRITPIPFKGGLNFSTKGNIVITGSSDVIGLCYGFGIGLCTGSGFGCCFDIKIK
jgi:CRISPR-associated endoribonuclease Cas6